MRMAAIIPSPSTRPRLQDRRHIQRCIFALSRYWDLGKSMVVRVSVFPSSFHFPLSQSSSRTFMGRIFKYC